MFKYVRSGGPAVCSRTESSAVDSGGAGGAMHPLYLGVQKRGEA